MIFLGIDWNRAEHVSFRTVKPEPVTEKPKTKLISDTIDKSAYGLLTIFFICGAMVILIIVGVLYKKCCQNKNDYD